MQPRPRGVRSADGTFLAFDRVGDGPPVILVDQAGHYRDLSSFEGLARLLAEEFTVYTYDRRGRGESGDSAPYAPEREVEDLEAVIAEAGGAACVYGYSSGALLALHAAAAGAPITRLAVLEPPIPDAAAERPSLLTRELGDLVAAGRNADAVEHFHRSIGVPAEFIDRMRSTPTWPKLEAVAPTLVYDCVLSDAIRPELLRAVAVPTLVLDSEGTGDDLAGWAAGVAAFLPNGRHRSLPGEWHSVPDHILAPALMEFFRRRRARRRDELTLPGVVEGADDTGAASGFSVDEDEDGGFRWTAFGPAGTREGTADSREAAESAAQAAERELTDPSQIPPR